MTKCDRRWAWPVPGGPWAAAGALVVAAAVAFGLATVGSGPVPGLAGWPLLVVLLGLILGVTPFGVRPRSMAPVRVGRFAYTFGTAVLLTALLAGTLDPVAAAVFSAGLAAAMVLTMELIDAVTRRFAPPTRL